MIIQNDNNVDLDDSRTETFCIAVEYKITVAIKSGSYDGTDGDQFVKISGTKGETEELQCLADFSAGTSPTCEVDSHADIGEYTCVIWRTVGTDGWIFSELDMNINGVAQKTFHNNDNVDLDDSETETFCIAEWTCHGYSTDDTTWRNNNHATEKQMCERTGGRKFNGGDKSIAEQCGVCWCCKPSPLD